MLPADHRQTSLLLRDVCRQLRCSPEQALEKVQRLNQELEMLQFCNPELGVEMADVKTTVQTPQANRAERKSDKAKFTHVDGKGWVNDATKEVEKLPADAKRVRFFYQAPPSAPKPFDPTK